MQGYADSSVTLNPDVVHRPETFGGVLLDLETKAYYPVNHVGYKIVGLLDAAPSLPHILDAMADYYATSLPGRLAPASIERICDGFLGQLSEKAVVRGYHLPRRARTASAGPPSSPDLAAGPGPFPVKLKAPLVVSLAVSSRCNLRCAHCYAASTQEVMADNLTQEEILAILRQLRALEVFDVAITGGEPLWYKDIYDVLSEAKRLGLYVCLNTNGTLVTRAIARRLGATGVDVVKVSLDSATPNVHDAFRGQPRTWERSVNGIRCLVQEGVRTDVHTVISTDSAESTSDIDAILDLARESQVTRVHFDKVFSTGRTTNNPRLKLDERQILRLIDYVMGLKAQGETLIGRVASKAMPVAPAIPDYDGCGGCARGVYVYIGYNGGVYPCTNLCKQEWRLGSLREQSLHEILTTSPVLVDLRLKLADAVKTLSVGEGVHT